jgi:hypothetical protein
MPYSKRVAAPDAKSFHVPVKYPDGVTVTVTKIAQSTVGGNPGPGVVAGPRTTFTLVFHNATTKPLDLTQVVVSAVYGSPPQQASPEYGNGIQDFATSVPAGHSASAQYQFSIPTADLGHTTIGVDFDGSHTVAVFAGSAR